MSNKKRKPFFIIEGARAFTLVELLLALIIFAVVSVSLYNMFYNGIKLDAKSQYIHKTYNEARIAFDALARELPNALNYDFTGSYPGQAAFAGKDNELTFLLPTPRGIFAVRYYAGRPDMGKVTKTIIGGVVKNLKSVITSAKEDVPVDFLMRQQMPLPDFLAKSRGEDQAEILSAGLKKQGLKFAYADLPTEDQSNGGPRGRFLVWQADWQKPFLPLAVRVALTLFDPEHPDDGVELTREIYLPQGSAQ